MLSFIKGGLNIIKGRKATVYQVNLLS